MKERLPKIEFTTLADLGRDVLNLSGQLPPGIGAVLGVARSGLLPAILLATHYHCPVGCLETFIKTGLLCGAGRRMDHAAEVPTDAPILIVEDAVVRAEDINRLQTELLIARPEWHDRLYTAAVYATADAASRVNFYARIINAPRWFQWNWLNQGGQRYTAWDIDGALCVDPPLVDADEGGYEFCIANAKPLYVQRSYRIPLIVTNRLERHRAATEQWLLRHGVAWDRLEMNPAKTTKERASEDGYPFKRKADAYLADETLMVFVESGDNQAKQIYQATGKAVFCSSTLTMYQD